MEISGPVISKVCFREGCKIRKCLKSFSTILQPNLTNVLFCHHSCVARWLCNKTTNLIAVELEIRNIKLKIYFFFDVIKYLKITIFFADKLS